MKRIICVIILLPAFVWAQETSKSRGVSVVASTSIGPEVFIGTGWEVGYSQQWVGCVDWMLTLTQRHGSRAPAPETEGIISAYRTSMAFGCKVHGEFASIMSASMIAQVGLQTQLGSSYYLPPLPIMGVVPHVCSFSISPILRGGAVVEARVTDNLTLGLVGDCTMRLDETTLKYFSAERLSCSLGIKMGFLF